MTEPHICEYTHDCSTLYDLLPRFYSAPSLTLGSETYRVLCFLMIAAFDEVIERIDMIGLDESVVTALREARDKIDSELICENPVHNEIFVQFVNDGMKFLPALQAAHRV
jgi:hypothetical protein